MLIKCNNEKCKKLFTLDIQMGFENDGKIEIYFICPHCKKHYTSYYENRQTLSIQDQINTLNAQIQNMNLLKKGMDFKKEFNKKLKLRNQLTKLIQSKKRILEKINRK